MIQLIFKQESNKCLGQSLVDKAAKLVKKVSLQQPDWNLLCPSTCHYCLLLTCYWGLPSKGLKPIMTILFIDSELTRQMTLMTLEVPLDWQPLKFETFAAAFWVLLCPIISDGDFQWSSLITQSEGVCLSSKITMLPMGWTADSFHYSNFSHQNQKVKRSSISLPSFVFHLRRQCGNCCPCCQSLTDFLHFIQRGGNFLLFCQSIGQALLVVLSITEARYLALHSER